MAGDRGDSDNTGPTRSGIADDYASSSAPPVRSSAPRNYGMGISITLENKHVLNPRTGTLDSFSSELSEARNEETQTQDVISTPGFLPPTVPDKPRKPSMTRMSSKRHVPHKRQGFSTDDDAKEVEEAQNIAYQHARTAPSPRVRPMSSTLRRRTSTHPSPLKRLDSDNISATDIGEPSVEFIGDSHSLQQSDSESEADIIDESQEIDEDVTSEEDADMTLKDRQAAINQTHPFGIRIWKPAVYKKSRSVEKTAEGDIHSSPGGHVSPFLYIFNLLWSLCFGWWLALAALLAATACFFFSYSPSALAYARVFSGLSRYLLYPFGSFVLLESDAVYAEEDEGEGRSISEYEQWQNGDLEYGRLFFGPRRDRSLVGRRRNSVDSAGEQDSLLGRPQRGQREDSQYVSTKSRFFGRGEWTLGRVVFFAFFYFLVGPLMLVVSLICWLLVFFIPMGRVTLILASHLRRHPLALSFHSDSSYARLSSGSSSPSILLCTYRAAGTRYWKYTIDGTNIFFINLLVIVFFVIADYFFLSRFLGVESWLTHPGLIFTLALFSIIPLAYFIGQAVASISAQSSMGVGATINAFFSTIVEVYLYCVALTEGKAHLVEGSIIGSILAGLLFLPGLSMCFGAIHRKTQRFNVQSAGVTSTMLLFAIIAALGPTLFYEVYGSHELNCHACVGSNDRDCRQCYFSQSTSVSDNFYEKAVQPYVFFSAIFLFFSYGIGLLFTLRTHAATIWSESEEKEKKVHNTVQDSISHEPRQFTVNETPEASGAIPSRKDSIRESPLYKRILGQSLIDVGLDGNTEQNDGDSLVDSVYLVPPRNADDDRSIIKGIQGLSGEDNERLVRRVTEVVATAAATAARDDARRRKPTTTQASGNAEESVPVESAHAPGGHDAPNWSKAKSSIILLGATVLYAIVAEILVDTVDVVLESVDIDEKFLGITLFALVPNTTEFLNAISFAMNGNIALSMEIGSAYALQVCMLQIPALVFFSSFYTRSIDPAQLVSHSFSLIFPRWDMIVVILCVFLLSNVQSEGKSNYFKGSILVLTYLVLVIGFYLSGYSNLDSMGIDRFDTLALGNSYSAKFNTVGRGPAGIAY
ncbi:hypothetical protein N7495_007155 [Penicillium taxi]|uniref:uncharacterized protein n=1 Tax=Penicillium taxi TaxID=168475 RepID=UPI0025455826|nr:uncharacterized protein N7495_007155 [Penicillium taxi]KAJ5895464.1 hypothetical protein N7495_007155 [Penicillium taxi]